MIHHATTELDGDPYNWVSLDGDDWLPINRAPSPGDEDVIQQLFDGDGNFMPLRFTRRWLKHWGADFKAPIE